MKPEQNTDNNQQPSSRQPTTRTQWWRTILFALAILLGGAVTYSNLAQPAAVGQRASSGALDPLSTVEEAAGLERLGEVVASAQVSTAQVSTAQVNPAQVNEAPANAPASSVAAGRTVVLLVDRHQPSKTELARQEVKRQADGYIYNYDTDTLQHVLIDLETDVTEIMETVQDVQLPLIPEEKEKALNLIRNDETAWQTLRDQHQAITGAELTDLSQLDTKIQTFQADAMPSRVNQASSHCGRHRCAQVLLFTHDRVVFETTPIVDLSTNSVTQLFWEN